MSKAIESIVYLNINDPLSASRQVRFAGGALETDSNGRARTYGEIFANEAKGAARNLLGGVTIADVNNRNSPLLRTVLINTTTITTTTDRGFLQNGNSVTEYGFFNHYASTLIHEAFHVVTDMTDRQLFKAWGLEGLDYDPENPSPEISRFLESGCKAAPKKP